MHPSDNRSATPAVPLGTPAAVPSESLPDPQIAAFVASQPARLHSRESWARQQVLEYFSAQFKGAMAPLTALEQRSYLELFRALVAAKTLLDEQSKAFVEAFETAGLQALRTAIKQASGWDLDPRATYVHSAYAVDPPRKRRATATQGARSRRELDATAGTMVEVKSLSLWQAACLNFAFFDVPEMKRRWISRSSSGDDLDEGSLLNADTFIRIVRELNLGADLRRRVVAALQPDAVVPQAIKAYVHGLFRFNLYDAPRTVAHSRINRERFDSLRDALARGAPWLKVEWVALTLPDTLGEAIARRVLDIEESLLHLFSHQHVDFAGFYLPALILRVSGETGLYSYCAERPDGVLRHHPSLAAFEQEFKAQLKADNARKALGWLVSSLAFEQQGRLWQVLEPAAKPAHLNWLADKLYDAFHWVFPDRHLEDIGLVYQDAGGDPEHALARFFLWRFRLNTEAIAVPKGQQDLHALKDGILSLMHQLLDLLLIPVPGGLSGLGRLVMLAMAGRIGLELLEGGEQARAGNPLPLLQTVLGLGNLLLLGGLQGYAARLATQRIGAESGLLDKYRRVELANGKSTLWTPSLLPYARKVLELPSLFDEQGLGVRGSKRYGQVREQGKDLTVELAFDPELEGYRARHPEPGQFHPPMTYDRLSRRWAVDLDDSRQLADTRLLERIVALKGGSGEQARRIIAISGVRREQLEQIWAGGPPEPALLETLERFEAEQGIAELQAGDEQLSLLSEPAQRALFALLPELLDWPADLCLQIYTPAGELQEAYGRQPRLDLFNRTLAIRRLEHGSFIAQPGEPSTLPSVPAVGHEAGLLDLIVGQLHDDAGTGGVALRDPFVRRATVRSIRHQLRALARIRSAQLFEALGRHAGRTRFDASSSATGQQLRGYLPVFRQGLPAPVMHLLRLYPQVSLARLARFLADHPLSTSQGRSLLDTLQLPAPLRHDLEQTEHLSVLGRVFDSIYRARLFHADTDAWLQAIAADFIHARLGRTLRWGEGDRRFFTDGTDLPLRRYGQGIYAAFKGRRPEAGDLLVLAESFYQALAASLSERERMLLGMGSATDLQTLRNALGAYLGALRRPDGRIGLALEHYARATLPAAERVVSPAGVYRQHGELFVYLDLRFYPVAQDARCGQWRIVHPLLKGAYAPRLEHNDHGGWWHEFEDPLAWDGPRALRRLESSASGLSDTRLRQILTSAGVDERWPGRLLFENERAAGVLREVTRRFTQALVREHGLPIRTELQRGDTALQRLIRQQFPRLSVELAGDLLGQLDFAQRRLMRERQRLPLALMQQARYLSAEVDVSELYASLCLPTARSDSHDRLLLQLLDRLPGWSAAFRLELRAQDASGPLLASIGDESAVTRRILVKSDQGYVPYAPGAAGPQRLATPREDPLAATLLALPALSRTTLAVRHGGDEVERDLKRLLFQVATDDRNQVRRVLGHSPVLPWMRLPQRLLRQAGGALGYPLSGRGRAGLHPPQLFRQLRKLYRGCADTEITNILQRLGATPEARAMAVRGLQGEYRCLQEDLQQWLAAPQLEQEDLPFSDTRVQRRAEVARRLKRCWRRQSAIDGVGPRRYMLVLDGLDVEDLPELNADFSHVELLSMNDMALDKTRYLSRFLRSFTGLRILHMERNGLASLPNAFAAFNMLEALSLEGNALRLTQGAADELAGLVALQRLNLNGNPLQVLPDFGLLPQLQVLRLGHCGIVRWPRGLLSLRHLARVDLQGNALRDLPEQLFTGHDPLCLGIDLSGNPLSAQALAAIGRYRTRSQHVGVRFGLENLELAPQVGIDCWAEADEQAAGKRVLWQRVRDQPNADVFFLLFDRMSAPPTFFHVEYQAIRNDLTSRVWRVLEAAAGDLLLCEELFQREAQCRSLGLTSYQTFNRLEFAVDCHDALALTDEAAVQARLLSLLRGRFRLGVLSRAVLRRYPIQSVFWYRAAYEALAAPLALPDQFNGVFSPTPGRLDEQLVASLKEEVLLEEMPEGELAPILEAYRRELPEASLAVTGDENPCLQPAARDLGLIDYLAGNDTWIEFLNRAYSLDFQRVFGRLFDFDQHEAESEYDYMQRSDANMASYTRQHPDWVRHWTVKALSKAGVSALGRA